MRNEHQSLDLDFYYMLYNGVPYHNVCGILPVRAIYAVRISNLVRLRGNELLFEVTD